MDLSGAFVKRIIRFVAIVLLILLTICIYYLGLQPALSHYVFETKSIHQGKKYYETGEYLEFESGSEFECFLISSQYVAYGEIIDFYHVDNHLRDNPFYGKMCDVFSVDIQTTESELSSIIFDDDYYCGEIKDYTLYQIPLPEYTSSENIALIALCAKQNKIRVVLITDIEHYELKHGYTTVLLRQSSLEWGAGNDNNTN